MQGGEIKNFVWVWLTVIVALCHCYTISKRVPKGLARLLTIVPIIDGFEEDKKVVVIAATNRKQDLDPALISRFDSMITFGLPDHKNRQEITAQYAKHLSESELVELATETEGMSGRDIRDVCLQAERRWASKIIRGQGSKGSLPPVEEYSESALNRKRSMVSIEEQKAQDFSNRRKQAPLALG